jgi:hypothetical protein
MDEAVRECRERERATNEQESRFIRASFLECKLNIKQQNKKFSFLFYLIIFNCTHGSKLQMMNGLYITIMGPVMEHGCSYSKGAPRIIYNEGQ